MFPEVDQVPIVTIFFQVDPAFTSASSLSRRLFRRLSASVADQLLPFFLLCPGK